MEEVPAHSDRDLRLMALAGREAGAQALRNKGKERFAEWPRGSFGDFPKDAFPLLSANQWTRFLLGSASELLSRAPYTPLTELVASALREAPNQDSSLRERALYQLRVEDLEAFDLSEFEAAMLRLALNAVDLAESRDPASQLSHLVFDLEMACRREMAPCLEDAATVMRARLLEFVGNDEVAG